MAAEPKAQPTKQELPEPRQDHIATRWQEAAKGRRVRIRWMDGHESEGKFCGWDRYTYLIEVDGKSVLVMKHAVASLAPA